MRCYISNLDIGRNERPSTPTTQPQVTTQMTTTKSYFSLKPSESYGKQRNLKGQFQREELFLDTVFNM